MMKQWKQYCSVPIKGVVIERIAYEFMWSYTYRESTSKVYYDYMIRDFLTFLKGKANTYIFMPGINEDIYIGNSWLAKAETAYSNAIAACTDEANSYDWGATYEWKKLFGDAYPY